jgi:hypothetical protein
VKIVPPITITDAMLVSSNVSEGPAPDYNAGTTYAAGDVVSGATANPLKYQWASLQNGNIGHTPGVSGSATWWRAIAYAGEQYDAGVTYPVGESGGGAQIDGDDVHQLWWSVVDDNTGNSPPADAGNHWLLMSATNRWAMFDQGLGFGSGNARIATRWGNLIDVTLEPDADVDTVCAWVIDADSVRVSVAATGYDETITLGGTAAEIKWQLDGVARLRPVTFEDVDCSAGDQIRIRIIKTGGVAVCAELNLGLGIEAGATLAPANVGMKDYSVIQTDGFGAFQVNKRAWHRRGSFQVRVASDEVDVCMDLLTQWRARPMLFLGASMYGATAVFGFFRSFDVVITFPGWTTLQIDLESI